MNEKDSCRSGEDERSAIGEQSDDIADERFRLRVVRGIRAAVDEAAPIPLPGAGAYATADGVATLLESCPAGYRPWLRGVLSNYALHTGHPQYRDEAAERLLDEIGQFGLVRGALSYLGYRYAVPAEGGEAFINDRLRLLRGIIPNVFRDGLEDPDPFRRECVIEWLPGCIDAAEEVALLARVLARPCAADGFRADMFRAAVRLAALAPDTPGLTERLLDAACAKWMPDGSGQSGQDNENYVGARVALECLARLGACEMRDALLAALVGGNCEDAGEGTRLFLKWGGDAAELVRRSWDTAGERGEAAARLCQALDCVPPDTAGLDDRLAALIPELDAALVNEVSDNIAPRRCRAETLLPAAAAQLGERSIGRLLNRFLAAVSANPERWDGEGTWVFALLGRPADDVVWLVYADWLDEQDDARSEFVRLGHALATAGDDADPEASERAAAWLADHGRGWDVVYRMISEWVPPAPEAEPEETEA